VNEVKLSKRLETVANSIPIGAKIVDIGSDHAYLPIYCYLNGIVSFAVAGEVVEGPFQTARNQVKRLGLDKTIDVRKGDGLEVVSSGEVDVVTICGMGGALITSILDSGKEKLIGVKRLILQPNISAISIRKWLILNGWTLTEEFIIEEDNKIYEVLVAEEGNPLQPYTETDLEKQLLLGPYLLREKSSVFIKKWKFERQNWERIVAKLEEANDSEEIRLKKEEIFNQIRFVEEALK
jgi:tRNA (adenine22-N1)-methyltransferase